MSELIDHLETHLGRIVAGWSQDADGWKLPFQVALLEQGRRTQWSQAGQGSPVSAARVLVTLGLSSTPLRIGDTGRRVKHELVLLLRERFGYRHLCGVLQQVGLKALQRDRAYSAGEVVGPLGAFIPGPSSEAVYIAVPVYFPIDVHVFRPSAGDRIAFRWLVPVTAQEASLIRERGWAALDEELDRQDPDRQLGLLAMD